MSEHEQHEQEPTRGSVSIWTTAKGRPQWKVRVGVGEAEAEVEHALSLALAADRRAERELAGTQPFVGEEPGAGGER